MAQHHRHATQQSTTDQNPVPRTTRRPNRRNLHHQSPADDRHPALRETIRNHYKSFQASFKKEIVTLSDAEKWRDGVLETMTNRYLERTEASSSINDRTYGAKATITYYRKDLQPFEQEFPLQGITDSSESLKKMQSEWEMQLTGELQPTTNLPDNQPDFVWIHLPANNMKWVEDSLVNILKFFQQSICDDTVTGDWPQTTCRNILQSDYWHDRFNRNPQNHIYGRSMKPFARYVTTNEPQEDAQGVNVSSLPRVLTCYLPYLHWERSIATTYMKHVANDTVRDYGFSLDFEPDVATRHIESLNEFGSCSEENLLRRYLLCKSPLHVRRTLDQFGRPYLSHTEIWDHDQVIQRYYKRSLPESAPEYEEFKDESPMLMVDQLWLWVIGDRIVFTCFPAAWNQGPGFEDRLDVRKKISKYLEKAGYKHYLQSAMELAIFIIEQCASNMLEPRSLIHERHKFLYFYEYSISMLRERKLKHLRDLWHMVAAGRDDDSVLRTVKDFKMLEEVQDIIEELQMIKRLMNSQDATIDQLQALPNFSTSPSAAFASILQDHIKRQKRRRDYVDGLEIEAMEVREELKALLSLKQQEASIIEAQSSRRLAEESSKQSASIMLFTVVTILFLPLSTMASIFGINSSDLGTDGLRLWIIFSYMFPISVACVAIALFLGFSSTARECLLLQLTVIGQVLHIPRPSRFLASYHRFLQSKVDTSQDEPSLESQISGQGPDRRHGTHGNHNPHQDSAEVYVVTRSSFESFNVSLGKDSSGLRRVRSPNTSRVYTSDESEYGIGFSPSRPTIRINNPALLNNEHPDLQGAGSLTAAPRPRITVPSLAPSVELDISPVTRPRAGPISSPVGPAASTSQAAPRAE